jgi:hypothetical protein
MIPIAALVNAVPGSTVIPQPNLMNLKVTTATGSTYAIMWSGVNMYQLMPCDSNGIPVSEGQRLSLGQVIQELLIPFVATAPIVSDSSVQATPS